ncbi:MAG: hypothetical protein ACE5FS_02050 [Paracoccaceae bacterium]
MEKLTLLTLAAETVEEAIAALKQARILQPKGLLRVDQAAEREKFKYDRDLFDADRAAFEKERTAYHRRILNSEKKGASKPSLRGFAVRALRATLIFVGLATAFGVISGGVALVIISHDGPQGSSLLDLQKNVCHVLDGFSAYRCGG